MDDDQQFCLRWNNHQSTLISVFDTLLENGTLVDCTLAAEGKFLKAHKVVLSACSPYFATLLSQQYDKHPIFILKDVKFQELRAMMDYMYRGEVNISQDQLAALLKAAESLQIKGLSDNRSSSSSSSAAAGGLHQQQQKQQSETTAAKSLQPPVPANKASGLTIENKRPLKSELLDSDVSGSREGSASPTSRKRKKVRRRSVVDTNNVLIDNHDQHSNSSSHSIHTGTATATGGQVAAASGAGALSSAVSGAASNSSANVLSAAAVAAAAAIKKTETVQQGKVQSAAAVAAAEALKQIQKQQAAAAAAAAAAAVAAQSSDDEDRCGRESIAATTEHDDGNDLTDNEHDGGDGASSVKSVRHRRDGGDGKGGSSSVSDLLLPKNEYDDVQDENVEDLTLDDEELMDELDQAGPSHGGDASSQGYAQWPLDREQNEAFIAAQDAAGGQHRDAQAEDLSITKMAGLTWDQLDARLSVPILATAVGTMPLVTTLREGNHPLIFPRDLSVSPVNVKSTSSTSSSSSSGCSVGGGGVSSGPLNSNNGLIVANLHNNNNNTTNNNNNNSGLGIPGSGGGSLGGGLGGGSSNSSSASSLHCSAEMAGYGFSCQDCGRSYKLKSSLRNHQKWECGKEPQFQCPYCVYRAKQKMHIGRHMERMHKERFFKMEGDKVIALEDPSSMALDLNHTV